MFAVRPVWKASSDAWVHFFSRLFISFGFLEGSKLFPWLVILRSRKPVVNVGKNVRERSDDKCPLVRKSDC